MKTTYLTSLTTRFNPFSPTSKTPRLLLSLLPPNSHKTIKISTTQLPRSSTEPSMLELGFKDGKTMKWSWNEQTKDTTKGSQTTGQTKVGLQDIVEEVDRHARGLKRKEELAG